MTLTINQDRYGQLLAQYQPQVIASEAENERLLEIIEELMSCLKRTPEQERVLQLLVSLVEQFEDKHYQLNASTPHSLLLHFMEARNLKQADLIGVISASRGVISEVVNGKRQITRNQAKKLGEFFSVDPGLFI
jgi:HTH-type transcriptional regulator / antitoxin HigA